ncbi:cation efflux protein, CzcI family [Massilia varians]|uniref:cation efflux protein, CzcI family n=1 Tax=Massilia varians TaxID=457921 RepID=UPI0025521F52|nr:cation efflux protein, CzcI family [Massilia varians]MDK6079472.1 DUF2946 family protein [Massilia varians]
MKRYFLILLLVLLPFQFSWAVAATYCAHEETSSAQHFGHHVHKHDKAEDGAKAESKTIKADTDCDYCHHVPASAIVPATPAPVQPDLTTHARLEVHRYPSHISDLIPRPDWQAPA